MTDQQNETSAFVESRERHDAFDRAVAEQSAQPAPRVAEPNVNDLQWVNQMQAAKDPNTGRRYYDDPKARERIEAARVKVFSGESIADIRAATEAILAGAPLPGQPAAGPAAPPAGTPAERARTVLQAGEALHPSELPAGTDLGGYDLSALPSDFGVTIDDIADLKAARQAGISQEQIAVFIRQRVAAQS